MPQTSAIVGDARCARSFPVSLSLQLVTHAWLAMRINPLPTGVRPQPPAGGGLPAAQKPTVQKKPAKGAKPAKPAKGGKPSKEEALDAGGPPPSLSTAEDGGGSTYEEWVELLLRCAQARYRNVMCGAEPCARMTAEQRAEALLAQLLGVAGGEAEVLQPQCNPLCETLHRRASQTASPCAPCACRCCSKPPASIARA